MNRIKYLVILALFVLRLEWNNGLKVKTEYEYSQNSDFSSSGSVGGVSSNIFEEESNKTKKSSFTGTESSRHDYDNSDYSQVDKEEEEEEEEEENSVTKSEGETEVASSEGTSKKVKHKEVSSPSINTDNLSKPQYQARQPKFDLASTLYPGSDISGTNYVFLSPAARKRIDKKIVQLRKGGKHHGSMRETIAVGEWQRRYYSRPTTERPELPSIASSNIYSRKEGSLFNWVIIALVVVLFTVIFVFICRSFGKE